MRWRREKSAAASELAALARHRVGAVLPARGLGADGSAPGWTPAPPSPPQGSGALPASTAAVGDDGGGFAGHSSDTAGDATGVPEAPGRREHRRRVLPVRERIAAFLPTTLRGGLVQLSARAAAGLALVGLLAVALGGCYLLQAQPEPVPAPEPSVTVLEPGAALPTGPAPRADGPAGLPSGGGGAASAGPGPVVTGGTVVVHVAGRVHRQGIVTLRVGARVADALEAAGGTTRGADTAAVNLARPLVDGEQVLVPGVGEAPAAGGGAPPSGSGAGPGSGPGPGGGSGSGAPLDLNSATPAQLQELPGVGPVLAQRILDWRTEHGRFSSVEELREVSGIGERTYERLAPKVRV